jgi:hypothetical protein
MKTAGFFQAANSAPCQVFHDPNPRSTSQVKVPVFRTLDEMTLMKKAG